MTSSSDNFTYSKGKRDAILVLLYVPKLLTSHQDKDLTISLNTKLHKKRCVVDAVTFYLVSCFIIITLHEKNLREAELQEERQDETTHIVERGWNTSKITAASSTR